MMRALTPRADQTYLRRRTDLDASERPSRARALRKILNHGTFDVPSRMEAFFIENPVSNRLTSLLATHPSMDERVEALQRYAGALDAGPAVQAPQQGP